MYTVRFLSELYYISILFCVCIVLQWQYYPHVNLICEISIGLKTGKISRWRIAQRHLHGHTPLRVFMANFVSVAARVPSMCFQAVVVVYINRFHFVLETSTALRGQSFVLNKWPSLNVNSELLLRRLLMAWVFWFIYLHSHIGLRCNEECFECTLSFF